MSSRSATWSRSPTGSAATTASTRSCRPSTMLVDKANLLTLSAPEMTVLVGGLRVLEANWDGTSTGVLTDRPGVLTNDFFVNLLEFGTTWKPLDPGSHAFEGRDDATGEAKWIGSRADLVFGSNSELRALAEVYASDDAEREVRARLRRGLGQGHRAGPVRPALSSGSNRERASPPALTVPDRLANARSASNTITILGCRPRSAGRTIPDGHHSPQASH